MLTASELFEEKVRLTRLLYKNDPVKLAAFEKRLLIERTRLEANRVLAINAVEANK